DGVRKVKVTGKRDSTPNKTFTIELFVSPSADPSTFGEGKTFLGTATASTNNNGDATFQFTSNDLPDATLTGAAVVTATATRAGDTSEFSNALGLFVVTNTDDDGPGSLRQAILNANAAANARITFEVPTAQPTTDV